MIYCDHCVMPNTRPGINFTKDKEGKNICSACINHKNKENIDYKARFKELEALCDKYRRMNGKFEYDCAIAVSGGKDSHFQVHIMKEKLGMNPILFSVEDFCNFIGISKTTFWKIVEKHYNMDLFYKNDFGEFKLKNPLK